ncbi:MAG: hypothetical protein V7K77_31735 [Nostoc sp.]|uniref:hypothetical protein n=1 Tax=Nostoc sp. TaxID=1180 RepID=UPI002FF72AB6
MSVTDNNIDVYTPVTDTTTQDIIQKLQKVVKTGATQGWKRLGAGANLWCMIACWWYS